VHVCFKRFEDVSSQQVAITFWLTL